MTATFRHDLAGLGLVLAAVGTILALAEIARRCGRWESEDTRKVAHVGSGLVAAAFPWLLSSALVVGVLCSGFAALMAVTAARGFLPAVHAVPRRTWGGVLFPCGVALAFGVSARPAPFVAAVLALALGDATAALVGRRCGRHAYRFGGATRSVEGSTALFLTTALIVLATLRLLDGLALPEAAAWALVVAAFATAIEAASQDGCDNLLLPVAVALSLAPAAGPARGDALVLVAVAATVLASLLDAARQPGAHPTGGRRRGAAVSSPFARVLGVRPAAFLHLVRAGGPW